MAHACQHQARADVNYMPSVLCCHWTLVMYRNVPDGISQVLACTRWHLSNAGLRYMASITYWHQPEHIRPVQLVKRNPHTAQAMMCQWVVLGVHLSWHLQVSRRSVPKSLRDKFKHFVNGVMRCFRVMGSASGDTLTSVRGQQCTHRFITSHPVPCYLQHEVHLFTIQK